MFPNPASCEGSVHSVMTFLFSQFSDLASNPTVSGVRTFTEQLTTISSNLTFSGDIIQVGNLLFGSVEVLTQNPSLYEQNSYNVSSLYLHHFMDQKGTL